MEAKVSEILENILSLLSLEGSFEVNEKEDGVFVTIDTDDAGKLIGHQGETLSSLQLIVNQILAKQEEEFKRVIIDVSGWRRTKEEELAHRARRWAEQVKETGEPLELEPMPSWQRRIVHMTIQETDGVSSESLGEGLDRHLVIRPGNQETKSQSDEPAAD
ncbi:MAG: protein jag [Candidatus Paceibacterales bacterium]